MSDQLRDTTLEPFRRLVAAASEQIEEAIAFREAAKPAETDTQIIGRYNNTYAAHVFNLVRWSLSAHVAMSCARLWEDSHFATAAPIRTAKDKRSLSLLAVAGELEKDEVQKALANFHGDAAASIPFGRAAISGKDYSSLADVAQDEPHVFESIVRSRACRVEAARLAAPKHAQDLRNAILTAKTGRLAADLEALGLWRNVRGAHRQVHPDLTVAGPLFPSSDALDRVLEATRGFVSDAFFLANYGHHSFDELPQIWSKYGAAFWSVSARSERRSGD